MKSKRIIAVVLLSALLLSLFSGCTKTESDATIVDGKKVVDTDIVMATTADIVTFDPQDCTDGYSGTALTYIFDTLVEFDENSELVGSLAESWENPSPLEYTFHLRKGVKFHNGEELKVSDVKFTFDRILENPKSKYILDRMEEFIVIDDYTFTVKLSEPYSPLLNSLAEYQGSIVNEKAVKEAGENVNMQPVGTGRLKLGEYRPNDYTRLDRFDDCWAEKPVMTSLTLKVIPEPATRTIALESGDVDIVTALTSIDVPRIQEDPNLKVYEYAGQALTYLCPNHLREPFDDIRVRQAMNYATDQQKIIDVVFEGQAIPATSPFPNIMPSWDETLNVYSFDLEKAKALLTEAGYADGIDVEVLVSSEERMRAATVMQADWAEVGLNMSIEQIEFGTLLDRTNNADFDAFIMSWGHALNQDRTMTTNFHSSNINGGRNCSGWVDEETDRVINVGRTEIEWPKREQAYKDLQKHLVEQAVWVYLFQQVNYAGMNKNLEGVIWHKSTNHDYGNMYIVE